MPDLTMPPLPITVNPSAIPAGVMLAVRQIAVAAGGYLIGKGYLSADVASEIGAVLLVLAPIVWGQVRSYLEKQKSVTIAAAAPDSVAIVTK